MKIKIIQPLDREAKKIAKADHEMPVGQIFLVKDEIGAALMAGGYAEVVEPKK